MRLIVTADLHQWIPKWKALVAVVEAEKPRFVLIAGDLLPKAGHSEQKAFFRPMREYFQQMKAAAPVTVLTYFGNDDHHVLEPLLDELAAEGLCVNLNGRVHREEGLVFCGMNKVRDYPFGYKHWCVPDGDFVACPEQFCGQGLTMNQDGEYIKIPNLVEYLTAKPSIGAELDRLKQQLGPGEMTRSVWMVHGPPDQWGMDVCANGLRVGSPTVRKFVAANQPLLGCSGHIHESPYTKSGKWIHQEGRTIWIQPGQVDREFHSVSLEINADLSISGVKHSHFGSYPDNENHEL